MTGEQAHRVLLDVQGKLDRDPVREFRPLADRDHSMSKTAEALSTVPADDGRSPPAETAQRASLCLIIDSDFGFLQEFSRSLRGAGVDTVELLSSARLGDTLDDRSPDLVFLDLLPAQPYDCMRALFALKECGFVGHVQLFGRCEAPLLENFRRMGADLSLAMLPVLQKPFNLAAVRKTVREQKLDCRELAPPDLSLKNALARNLVTFWYQPKIDLRMRQVVGVEALAGIPHPQQHGMLLPSQFLPGAEDDALLELARRAVVDAVELSAKLDQLGVFLQIAVNIGVEALLKLPVAGLVARRAGRHEQRPWLLFEVAEAQAIHKVTVLRDKLAELEKSGVSLSIDNLGHGDSSFSLFRYLPFWDIKIDPLFVQGCADNKANANICKSMIQIAHNFSRSATAVGIETAADALELARFGCDVAQGNLFGRPMSEQQLLTMITAGRAESKGFCSSSAWDVSPRTV